MKRSSIKNVLLTIVRRILCFKKIGPTSEEFADMLASKKDR